MAYHTDGGLNGLVWSLAPKKVDGLTKYLSNPKHFVVAVQRHDGHLWTDSPEDRFLWIKARYSTRVEDIAKSYLASYAPSKFTVSLTINGREPPPDGVMSSLESLGYPKLVVFTAACWNTHQMPPHPQSHVWNGQPMQSFPGSGHSTPVPQHSGSSPVPGPAAWAMRAAAGPQYTTATPPTGPPVTGHVLSNHTPVPAQPSPSAQVKSDSGSPSRPPLQPVNRQVSNKLDRVGSLKSETGSMSPKTNTPDTNAGLASRNLKESPSKPKPASKIPVPEAFNPFDAQDESQEEATSQRKALRDLLELNVPERLEAGVRAGVEVLGELEDSLKTLTASPDSQAWLDQIARVRQEAVKSRTVVGVVGNTGAGKSSVINAMLDEERLVPTNCMRACTAVVTEISYNDSKLDNHRYRAEIEFIKPEDWRKELSVLVKEVFNDSGYLNKEISSPDTDAGIAYAKIRAVYNKFTTEMLSKTSVDKLMSVKSVERILGKTRKIVERESEAFYRRLQGYVDSKEKETQKLDKNGNRIGLRKRDMEFWPLIKVVRIFTKAEALSTGAVIVDLPGVHDSNAARAAVAEGYMKQCTGLWIVAPITRAVDDKAAKTLLGDTFKRQLQYDGTYSAVTFICSKTDDISRTEAVDSLQLGEEMDVIEARLRVLAGQRRKLQNQIRDAKENRQDHSDAIEEIDTEVELWEDLQSKLEDGKEVFAPSSSTNKKKRSRSQSPSDNERAKRRRRSSSDGDEDFVVSDARPDDGTGDDEQPSQEGREPLSEEQIEQKLSELKGLKKEARKEQASIRANLQELAQQLETIQAEEEQLDVRQNEMCIAGRNEYSRRAIRQDFAAGIRELDQENAIDEDDENFDPEEDIRDYEEVARSLPVFCVSSRSYQKLCGRLQKDNDVAGFKTKEQTEIPALQDHCMKLTENGRQANCRRFLNSLQQLLSSLALWASDDGTGTKMTDQQRNTERNFLTRQLKQLEKSLESSVKKVLEEASETLCESIYDCLANAAGVAAANALPTSQKWAAHRQEGGLHFMTYRATVRRNGVFSGASGAQDFNAQLSEPIYKQLGANWERVFQRRLPHILNTCSKSGLDLLKKFHAAIEARCREKGQGVARISLLANNLSTYKGPFVDMAQSGVNKLNESQREINREFTPVIAAAMEPAYEKCGSESGTGTWKRMKGHMHDHVAQNQQTMFEDACEKVKGSLKQLCKDVEAMMLEKADGVYLSMQRDYMSLIGQVNVNVTMSREERVVRRGVEEILGRVNGKFSAVTEKDMDVLKAEQMEFAAASSSGEDDIQMEAEEDEEEEEEEEEEGSQEQSSEEQGADGDVEMESSGVTSGQQDNTNDEDAE